MERVSLRMHKALFRSIGEELPCSSHDFKSFLQAIPLSPRDKAEHNTRAEDLLDIWERRGGIALGSYDQLCQLLQDTKLIKILRIANRHVEQIMAQLTNEKQTTASLADIPPRPEKARLFETQDHAQEIQCELRNWYKHTLSRLQPIPWCEWLEHDLDHHYTNLEIIPGLKEQISLRSNSDCGGIQKLSDVFSSDLSNKSVCLIEGPAGIGKSTLCRRFVHLWSENNYSIDDRYFDLAFLLEARLLTGKLKNCINEQLFPKDFRLSKDNIYDCLCNPQSKGLLIIDGVDELTAEGKTSVMELLNGEKLRDVNLLLTGRPEASREFVEYANSHFRITGFSDENVEKYISKYFGSNGKNAKDMLLERLANDRHLKTIMTNPFTTLLVCSLVADTNGNISANLIDILREVFDACYRKYVKKNEGSGMTLLSRENLFSDAGHLAYNGIKQHFTAFSEETLASFCPHGSVLHLLNSGILSKDFTVSRLHPKSFCYFPHKLFQEFFCAKYLAALDLTELRERCLELTAITIINESGNMLKCLFGMLQCEVKTNAVLEIICQLTERSENQKNVLQVFIKTLKSCDRSEDLLELLAQRLDIHHLLVRALSVELVRLPDPPMDPIHRHGYMIISFLELINFMRKIRLLPVVVAFGEQSSSYKMAVFRKNTPNGTRIETYTYVPKPPVSYRPRTRYALVGFSYVSWPFLLCKCIADANGTFPRVNKVSVLAILLVPGEQSEEDITALKKNLTSTNYNVSVLFLVLEDLPDDYHFVRMVSLFSSLQNISFIKIRCVCSCHSPREFPIRPLVRVYDLDSSIIQTYYSKVCPY